ncbi:MAG: glycosyltransferase [Pseudomonas sp.]|jgi:glycosyltransferase involved in cell wall biosynthesis|uniref:glycosyltransferase n=1 Tax=Pseudomonas sp. TaxID=306 RepID=UPI003981FB20
MSSSTPILFTHYGDDWIRGSERCLLDLLSHLDRKRFTPYLWCNSPVMARAAEALQVHVTQQAFPVLLGWQAPRFDWRGYRQLLRSGRALIEQHAIKLLHANSGAPCQWLVPLARQHKLPLLAHLHARYLLRDRCTLRLSAVDLAVGVSQPVLAGLLADGMRESRLQVVPNGIDVKRLEKQPVQDMRALLHLPSTTPLLATLGSLIERKGVDIVLEALRQLHADGLAAHLLVIGEEPERAALDALAHRLGLRECVHFLGESSTPLGILRGGVDVLVSGAREEVFGLALAEGSCASLPVVAPRVGGIAEVVEHGHTGLLVPANDSSALASAVARLLRDPVLAKQMGKAGRQRVLQCFTASTNAQVLQACYDRLLQAKPRDDKGYDRTCWRWAKRALQARVSVNPAAEPWL